MAIPNVTIKGQIKRREFKEPFRQCTEMLEQIGSQYTVNSANADDTIDFALLFQSYPYEFTQDLMQLRRRNPFAPLFFVLGVCCEGMLRTAYPLDSPFYRYVHAWSDRDTEQVRLFLIKRPSIFSLPLATENDEITVSSAICRQPSAVPSQPSLILTHFGPFGNDSAMNQLIADEQRQRGFEPEFCYRLPSVVCRLSSQLCRLPIFADVDDSPLEKILDSIQRLRSIFADNDFTVYVDSPRIDEKEGYIRAGVTQVLPKIR